MDNHDESIPECDLDDCTFWSILTDTVSYYQKDHVSSLVLESDSTDTQDTHYTCAKEMYFCAANNNVPYMNEGDKHEQNQSFCTDDPLSTQSVYNTKESFKSKHEYFMAAHCNEPELNTRYPVKTSIKTEFHPGKCVATTYLWSERDAESENKGIFDMEKIAIRADCTVQGTLLNPEKNKIKNFDRFRSYKSIAK